MSWSWSDERPPKEESPYPEFPKEPILVEDPISPDSEDIRPQTPDAACDSTDSDEETNIQLANHGSQKVGEDQAQRWLGQKKWGFVIYRFTYADDAKWAEFMSAFTAMARDQVVEDPELDETLALDVREDPDIFSGGTGLETAREHFQSWVQSDEMKTEVEDKELKRADQQADFSNQIDGIQNRVQRPAYLRAPRYNFFIQIDAAAMESLLAEKGNSEYWRARYCGWVNIVNSSLPLTDKLSIVRVTPSQLYPNYYKAMSSSEMWYEMHLMAPLVEVGHTGGYWPEKKKYWHMLHDDEKREFWDRFADSKDEL